MILSKTIGGNYPLKMNIQVYDAALLQKGELVMRHASWHAANKYYISAYVAGVTEAEDTIGVLEAGSVDATASKENGQIWHMNADALPDQSTSTGCNFLPAIVNPDAIYFAEYDQTDAVNQSVAVTASTAWACTTWEDNIDGAWLFTTTAADSAATYAGKLRYAVASAGGTVTTGVAVTVDTSTDVVKVLPSGHRITTLNAEATGLSTEIAAGDSIYLEVIENYVEFSGSPSVPLRYWKHKGLDGLKGLRVQAEIVQLRHAWRAVVA